MKYSQLSKGILFTLFSILLLLSCSDDDGNAPIDQDPQTTLEEARLVTTEQISGGDTQVWKIASASLTNENGTFDISNNFNVVDDEFIFSSNGTLEWRQGNDINIDATTQQETLLDYYRSPINSAFEYKEESSTEFTALEGRIDLTVVEENTISGVIAYPGRSAGGEITVTLNQKGSEDYPEIPESGLSFSFVNSFESVMTVSGSLGITGSNATNSLYIVTREDSEGTNDGNPEKIFKLSLDTNTFEESLYFQGDFVSKRPFILNGKLVVFGGQFVNTYSQFDLSNPTTVSHSFQTEHAGLTRFGASVQNNLVYLTGGDINPNTNVGDKIRIFNTETEVLSDFVTMPQTRYWTSTEIVNDNLYVFGGQQNFVDDDIAETTSYICNLNTGNINTFELPIGLYVTFAVRREHLIYVGGQIREDTNGDGNIDNFDIFIGVYDTLDNTITEIEHDLDESDASSTIYGMTLFNGKLYVVYGDSAQTNDPPNGIIPVWDIMAADID